MSAQGNSAHARGPRAGINGVPASTTRVSSDPTRPRELGHWWCRQRHQLCQQEVSTSAIITTGLHVLALAGKESVAEARCEVARQGVSGRAAQAVVVRGDAASVPATQMRCHGRARVWIARVSLMDTPGRAIFPDPEVTENSRSTYKLRDAQRIINATAASRLTWPARPP